MRLTDVADTEQLFRIIQSIPSPKAEPFKQWMAGVASRRIDQMQDPELNFEQAYEDYRRLDIPSFPRIKPLIICHQQADGMNCQRKPMKVKF